MSELYNTLYALSLQNPIKLYFYVKFSILYFEKSQARIKNTVSQSEYLLRKDTSRYFKVLLQNQDIFSHLQQTYNTV